MEPQESYIINGNKYILESKAEKETAKKIIYSLRNTSFSELYPENISVSATVIQWLANRYGVRLENE